jgi:Holliday junction resolvasome RuvABC endonuclease subunit
LNVLAIDPGVRCGWASLCRGRVESGVQAFPLGRGESPGMRFIRFRAWLVEMLDLVKPGLVVYERPFMRGGFATELLGGLVTMIQMECSWKKIEYQPVNPATLKKAVCGSGRADKGAMVDAAMRRWGRLIAPDAYDEADALALLAYAIDANRLEEKR